MLHSHNASAEVFTTLLMTHPIYPGDHAATIRFFESYKDAQTLSMRVCDLSYKDTPKGYIYIYIYIYFFSFQITFSGMSTASHL